MNLNFTLNPFFEILDYSNFYLMLMFFLGYIIINNMISKLETLKKMKEAFRWYDFLIIIATIITYFILMYNMGMAKIDKEMNLLKIQNQQELIKIQNENKLIERMIDMNLKYINKE